MGCKKESPIDLMFDDIPGCSCIVGLVVSIVMPPPPFVARLTIRDFSRGPKAGFVTGLRKTNLVVSGEHNDHSGHNPIVWLNRGMIEVSIMVERTVIDIPAIASWVVLTCWQSKRTDPLMMEDGPLKETMSVMDV